DGVDVKPTVPREKDQGVAKRQLTGRECAAVGRRSPCVCVLIAPSGVRIARQELQRFADGDARLGAGGCLRLNTKLPADILTEIQHDLRIVSRITGYSGCSPIRREQ